MAQLTFDPFNCHSPVHGPPHGSNDKEFTLNVLLQAKINYDLSLLTLLHGKKITKPSIVLQLRASALERAVLQLHSCQPAKTKSRDSL